MKCDCMLTHVARKTGSPINGEQGSGFAATTCIHCLFLVSIAPRARFRLALQGIALFRRAIVPRDLLLLEFGTALGSISSVFGHEFGNFFSGPCVSHWTSLAIEY